jgi:hypothetical protein
VPCEAKGWVPDELLKAGSGNAELKASVNTPVGIGKRLTIALAVLGIAAFVTLAVLEVQTAIFVKTAVYATGKVTDCYWVSTGKGGGVEHKTTSFAVADGSAYSFETTDGPWQDLGDVLPILYNPRYPTDAKLKARYMWTSRFGDLPLRPSPISPWQPIDGRNINPKILGILKTN